MVVLICISLIISDIEHQASTFDVYVLDRMASPCSHILILNS